MAVRTMQEIWDSMMSKKEQHSVDWSAFIDGTRGAWEVWWDHALVTDRPTREDARLLMRAIKADPALAAIASVQDS